MAMANSIQEQTTDNWKTKTLLAGAVIGAVAGAGAAYLLIQRAVRDQKTVSVSAGEGVRLGLLVFGLLRQVALLGEE
jgi:hypothetical protein